MTKYHPMSEHYYAVVAHLRRNAQLQVDTANMLEEVASGLATHEMKEKRERCEPDASAGQVNE